MNEAINESHKNKRSAEGNQAWLLRSSKQQLLLLGVPALEPLDAARRIDKFLLAREKRVATPANADVHGFLGRTSVERVATRAMNRGFHVLGMYVSFHIKGRANYQRSRA